MAGRILLAKLIFGSIPNYVMSILSAPRGVMEVIRKLIKDFIQKVNLDDKQKIPLISWDNICTPKDLAGAGLHNLYEINISLGAKLPWNYYENPYALWERILKCKYLDSDDPSRIFTMRNPP